MTSRQKIERAYDNANYSTKDMAGMPSRFYMLDEMVISFLENFVDMLDKPENSDNIDDMVVVKEMLGEAAEAVNIVLARLEDSNESN